TGGKELTARQGDKADIRTSPPSVRLHKATISGMGLEDGDSATLEVSGDDGKTGTKVVVKGDRKGHGRNDIGLVKALRDKLGVKPGDSVVLRTTERRDQGDA
ncbi:hypothetical protein ACFLSJ_08545, partial [Verrucomicrobiota bacterium]